MSETEQNNIITQMQNLIKQIDEADYNYYVLNKPTIADKTYDALGDKLLQLEKASGIVLAGSPTQRVSGEVQKGFKKVTHSSRLYSLAKCNSYEELRTWLSGLKEVYPDINFTLEYKFDGLRLVLTYENGILVNAATRGNGFVGEDVTVQVKTIKSVPLVIDYKGKVIIQGEGMITLSNLEKYNKNAEEKLKNARNAAAGAIRNLDPKVTASRNLDIFFYDIMEISGRTFKTQSEVHEFLLQNRFLTSEMFFVSGDADKLIEQIEKIDKIKTKIDVLIDGMVLKVNNINLREDIGFTSKFPKWAIAYKFEALEVTSLLKQVEWGVGRTGKVTPIAIVEPVTLAGATVTRATLNNYQEILKKKIKLNSSVFIRRSNEVIPEILGLAEEYAGSEPIQKIAACPSCGGRLTEIGPNLFCTNKETCKQQIINKIAYFCSRNCMNIEGLSDKTIEVLYNRGKVKNISDLYKLKKQDFINTEGFKEKKINNVLNAIEKSKNCDLNNFLDALSINGVGEKTSKDLAKHFKTLDAIMQAGERKLHAVRDIGEVIAQNIIGYFKDADNIKLIEELKACGLVIKEIEQKQGGVFSKKKFVLTGTLPHYDRKTASGIIEAHGGEVCGSVSKNTDYVLAGEEPGSKLAEAMRLNIHIINEEEFEKMLSVTD